jgi:hypothetical protein
MKKETKKKKMTIKNNPLSEAYQTSQLFFHGFYSKTHTAGWLKTTKYQVGPRPLYSNCGKEIVHSSNTTRHRCPFLVSSSAIDTNHNNHRLHDVTFTVNLQFHNKTTIT